MRRVVKLCPHQFWSQVNPEIIIEWNKSTRKPNSNERCWSVSIDTQNYSYYSRYMDLTARKNLWFTKWELEEFISENLTKEKIVN